MSRHDACDEGEPDPVTRRVLCTRGGRTKEGLEGAGALFPVETGAAIGDLDDDAVAYLPHVYVDRTVSRELQRVIDGILDDGYEEGLIAANHPGRVRAQANACAHAFGEARHDVACDILERDGIGRKAHALGRCRQREKSLGQCDEGADASAKLFDGLCGGWIERFFGEEVELSSDERERRPKLVSRIGRETSGGIEGACKPREQRVEG